MKKILVTGSQERIDEFQQLNLSDARVEVIRQDRFSGMEGDADILFDLNLDENQGRISPYSNQSDLIVIGCAVKRSLAEMISATKKAPACTLAGINALPGFINRETLEISLFDEAEKQKVSDALTAVGLKHEFVQDRRGMVTPRVICMIINEACFTVQEGTAGIPDIDQAMKLGTNHPFGPFEWADRIGVKNVYEVLEGIRNETGEEKYKIAPYLRNQYLKNKAFIQ